MALVTFIEICVSLVATIVLVTLKLADIESVASYSWAWVLSPTWILPIQFIIETMVRRFIRSARNDWYA